MASAISSKTFDDVGLLNSAFGRPLRAVSPVP
jgi:hypothetical protein